MDPDRNSRVYTAFTVLTYAATIYFLSGWHTARLLQVGWSGTDSLTKHTYDIAHGLIAIGWCYWVPAVVYRGLSPFIWWGHLIYATLLWLPRVFTMYALRKDNQATHTLQGISSEGIGIYLPLPNPDVAYCAVVLLFLCTAGAAVYLLNGLRKTRPWSMAQRTFRLWSRLILLIALAAGTDWFMTGSATWDLLPEYNWTFR